jgi:arylsulfatase A-like enzyme
MAQAADFIGRHKDKRFFLYVPLTIPHYELLVPEDSLKEYMGKFPEKPYTGRGRKPGYPYDYARQESPKAACAAMITRMDRSIGEMLHLLEELELDEKTLVVFTSDNGPSRGAAAPEFFRAAGPLRGHKGSLYEGGIRVPAIARWPERVQAGVSSEHVWYFADVLPTLAELAHAEAPENIDGISFAPELIGASTAGRKQQQHEFLYWERSGQQAVRMGDWKAIRSRKDASLQLYNLGADIGETRDIAARHADVVARIETYLKTASTKPRPQIEPERPKGPRRFR